jgi:hypothetical protein
VHSGHERLIFQCVAPKGIYSQKGQQHLPFEVFALIMGAKDQGQKMTWEELQTAKNH